MAFTEVLVHIDHHANSAARLEVALGLARQHQARLTGLLVVRHGYPAPMDVSAARDQFEHRAAEADIEGRWLCVNGSMEEVGMTDFVLHHARFHDLVVIGQGSPESAWMGVPNDLPERAILESGRPVLIVPYVGTFATVGARVLVAWKGGHATTRAVSDAMPILRQAERVQFLTKNRTGSDLEAMEGDLAALCAHVGRHGVSAKAGWVVAEDTPFGDVLLNRVFDETFDLLVVGAYAHGIEGQPVLGSLARQLLREMTVPVLMSH